MKLINFLYGYGLNGLNDINGITGGSYNNISSTPSSADVGAIVGGVLAALGVFLIFILAIAVLMLIANWILFKKMGLEGWKSLIPFVKEYLQMEKTGVNQKWLLIILFGYILFMIPILGWIIYPLVILYYTIIYNVSLARSFGKSDGFAVGLILLSPIFLCILAFGDSKYVGAKPMNDVVFKNNSNNNNAVTKKTEKKESSDTFCSNCGEKVNGDDAFCQKCGNKLK